MSRFQKKSFLVFSFLFFFFAFVPSVSAHVKWFVNATSTKAQGYSLSEWPVLVFLAVVITILIVSFILDRFLKIPEKYRLYLARLESQATTLFNIIIGASLILFSLNDYLFAPNLQTSTSFDSILLCLQVLCGIALIFGLFSRIAAATLLILYFAVGVHFGLANMLDTLDVVGIALFLLVAGRPNWKLFDIKPRILEALQPYAVPILRVFTGLNLLILGFSEKILNPNLGQAFLDNHPWNFMKILGFEWFSDRTFILFAGGFEAIFGLLLLFGLITRLTALALAGFFVTTMILLGPIELIGHLPHFAIVFVLLVFGSGDKLRFGDFLARYNPLKY